MRPAVEHAIRTGYLKNALKIPFSLFLENIWDDTKHTVLTVSRAFNGEDNFVVRLWDIGNVNKNLMLPPYKESIIRKSELFSSSQTIIDDFRTLEYYHEDYEYCPEPEGIDTSMWVEDEQEEYRSMMDRYFFSIDHQIQRERVLWYNFMAGFLSQSFEYLRGISIDGQQCIIKEASQELWNKWALWRKHLLDFPAKIAPELVFCEEYERNVKKNTGYQEVLVREALAEKEKMESEWDAPAGLPYTETFVVCTPQQQMPSTTFIV